MQQTHLYISNNLINPISEDFQKLLSCNLSIPQLVEVPACVLRQSVQRCVHSYLCGDVTMRERRCGGCMHGFGVVVMALVTSSKLTYIHRTMGLIEIGDLWRVYYPGIHPSHSAWPSLCGKVQ